MAVKWTAEQQKVIDTRDRNLLVSAAAGSGKTAVHGRADPCEGERSRMRPIDIDQLLVVTILRVQRRER